MSHFITDKGFITAIINEMLMDGRFDRFNIIEEFFGQKLFEVDCSTLTLGRIIDADQYRSVRDERIMGLDTRLHREVPTHDELRSALHSSLLLPPTNIADVVRQMNGVIERSRSRKNHQGQEAVSIDTNLAYKRFLSRLFLEGKRFGIMHDNPKDLLVTISQVSVRELAAASNHKLDRHNEPQALKRFLKGRGFEDHLMNKPTLYAAKALNARAEHAAIRDEFTYYLVDNKMPDVDNSAKADEYIARELSRYTADSQIRQTVLTADDSMSTLLEAERLNYIVLDYPRETPRSLDATPWLLRELLYDLAIGFRSIRFEGTGVRLMSVWQGKSADDFSAERVCVEVADDSRIGAELLRDHRILQRFRSSNQIDLQRVK